MLPATGEESHTERKETSAAIWHRLFCQRNGSSEWQGLTKLRQEEYTLSGEVVRDTESRARGWERPLQIHAFLLQLLHQVVSQLFLEPLQ